MNELNPLGQGVLFSWFILGVGVVAVFRGRWGMLLSLMLGWMFLPMGEVDLAGIPPINKNTVTAGAALLGVVIFDSAVLRRFKFSKLDIPMAVWCCVPVLSVMANGPMDSGPDAAPWATSGLKYYDGIALFFTHTVTWGVPWLLGRVYLGDTRGQRDFLLAMFFMGLIYMPMVAVEMVMSPQWHRWFYGVHGHSDFSQTMRYGFWRPTVFMQHGLMVAFFMTSTTLAGYTAWKMGMLKKVKGVPSLVPLGALGATAVLCMSMGAWIQLVVGVLMIEIVKRKRMPMLLVVLALIPALYLTARMGLGMSADSIEQTVARVSVERAESIGYRFRNEDMVMEHAMQRPMLGWAGWGRERIYDQNGKIVGVSDGLWVITLGRYGVVGVISLYAWLLIPAVLALRKLPTTKGSLAPFAGTIAVVLIVLQLAIDTLPNAMTGPAYVAAAGGLATLASMRGKLKSPEDLYRWTHRTPDAGAGEDAEPKNEAENQSSAPPPPSRPIVKTKGKFPLPPAPPSSPFGDTPPKKPSPFD
ncbi:MAG: hypothetical protein ACI89L_002381 [Phycisphaerales bacterium]